MTEDKQILAMAMLCESANELYADDQNVIVWRFQATAAIRLVRSLTAVGRIDKKARACDD